MTLHMPDGDFDPQLENLAMAAAEVVDCMRVLAKSGSNLVAEVLAGREFIQFEHYPPNDVLDPESQAQYYFHAHPPERGTWNDYGHFHLFLRGSGIAENSVPAALSFPQPPREMTDDICHLIAISMDRSGRPVRLFTTNRWVTAETWFAATNAIEMLDRFVVDLSWPSWPLNRWLTAMLVLYQPHIEKLIEERDRVIDAHQAAYPHSDAFEDRALEVTSGIDIDLDKRLTQIRVMLGMD
jgi:hypothetical protein